jgi:hypothetical protein
MKYLSLFFTGIVLASCGAFDESPETLALEANQTIECPMSPEGRWALYPEYQVGTCGYLAPLWAFVDDTGSLYMEESANCETINEIMVDRGPNNPCQRVTMLYCTNEELNLRLSMHIFLQNRSEAFSNRVQWEGNVNITGGYLDRKEDICSSVYSLKAIYRPVDTEE